MHADEQLTTSQHKIDPDRLELDEEPLGKGFFGAAFRGRLRSEHESENFEIVAVKMSHEQDELNVRDYSQVLQQLHDAMSEEIDIMARIGHHENILKLIGWTRTTTNNRLCLITEFCSHKSLDKFLSESKEKFIDEIVEHCIRTTTRTIFKAERNTSWASLFQQRRSLGNITTSDLLCFAYQIANGMDFLQCREVIHRDLALRNILLTSDFVVKIGDFGLSRRTYCGNYLQRRNLPLPFKWTAPEALLNNSIPIESDLWTFGILLWELFTLGEMPYEQFDAFNEVFHFIVNEGKRLDKPPFAPVEIYELMKSLWNLESNLRVSLKQCKRHLMDKLKSACPPLSSRYEELEIDKQQDGKSLNPPESLSRTTSTACSYHIWEPKEYKIEEVVIPRTNELLVKRYRSIAIAICVVSVLIGAAALLGSIFIFTPTKPNVLDHPTTLLINVGKSIYLKSLMANVSDKQIISMHDETNEIQGIDFDCQQKRVFWSTCCTEKDAIWTATLNGTEQKELIKVGRPRGISIDWSSRNVYFASFGKSEIGVISFDGKYKNTFNLTGPAYPCELALDLKNRDIGPRAKWSIVLDLDNRHLFFSANGQIGRIDLDGSNQTKFVDSDITEPLGLVILYDQREVCWVDATSKQLSCIGLNQLNRRLVYKDLNKPDAMTAYNEERFYWTDLFDQKVYSVTIFGSNYTSFDVMGTGGLFGIVALPEKCLEVETECAVNNGGCPHMCLPKVGGGVSCMCSEDSEGC